MNKMKWLFAMMCILAMFAMTGCEVADNITGDKDTDGDKDKPTIDQPKVVANYKPANSDVATYHGFSTGSADSAGYLAGIIAIKKGATTTNDQAIQNWVTGLIATDGITEAVLEDYTALSGTTGAGENNEYEIEFKVTTAEGFTPSYRGRLIKVKIVIGKQSNTTLENSDDTLDDVFNDYTGSLVTIRQAIIDGFDINYQHGINGSFLLQKLIPSSKANKAKAVSYLLRFGANANMDVGTATMDSNPLGLVSAELEDDSSNAELLAIKTSLCKANAFLKKGHPYEATFINKVKGKNARGTADSPMGTVFEYEWKDNGDMVLSMQGMEFTHEFKGAQSESSSVYYGWSMGVMVYSTVTLVEGDDSRDGTYGKLIFKYE